MSTIKYRIVNIIASTNTEEELNLEKILDFCINSEYDPEFYPALKYKNMNPKVTILVHKKGKIIFCGAKSLKEIEIVKRIFFEDLERIGYKPQNNPICLNNTVFLGTLNREINLINICTSVEHTQYDPETFPGLFFWNQNPKFTAILFKSGKFSVAGLTDLSQISIAIKIIKEIAKSSNITQPTRKKRDSCP